MCKQNETPAGSALPTNGHLADAGGLWRTILLFTSFVVQTFFELAIKRCKPH